MQVFVYLFSLLLLLAAPGARAQTLPQEVTIQGVEFVLIPEGWFWYSVFALDLAEHTDDRPRHRSAKVWLDAYYIGKYEARARDLVRFMNAGAAPEDALTEYTAFLRLMHDDPDIPPGLEDCTVIRQSDGSYMQAEPERELPATSLSWVLADAFARWMGFRLPTEAEWEKAARGPDKRLWPWGDDYPDDTVAVLDWTSDCDPALAHSYPKGRSPYGIFHMAGNVGEYVADWYNRQFDDGIRDGVRNPALATEGSGTPPFDEKMKILKGGRWSLAPVASVIPARRVVPPHASSSRNGVRFALDANAVRQHLDNGTATVTKQ